MARRPLLSDYATQQRWQAILPHVRGAVLDVGCGTTRLPDRLDPGQPYVGVDISPVILQRNRDRYPQHRFVQANIDVEGLDVGGAQFDTIVMSAVLEHLHDPPHALGVVRPLLKPEGRLLLTTPSPLGDWVHKIGSSLGLFYAEKVVKHVTIFDGKALVAVVEEAGFAVENYQPFLLGINQLVICRVA